MTRQARQFSAHKAVSISYVRSRTFYRRVSGENYQPIIVDDDDEDDCLVVIERDVMDLPHASRVCEDIASIHPCVAEIADPSVEDSIFRSHVDDSIVSPTGVVSLADHTVVVSPISGMFILSLL